MHISHIPARSIKVRPLGGVHEKLTARLNGETAAGVHDDDLGFF
jgi:hypothetical protein